MALGVSPLDAYPPRQVWQAMRRGAGHKCPACGGRGLFARFLKVRDACASCGEELHHHRADDAPPYFTIFIVGHLIVPPLMWLEKAAQPAIWLHLALWLPLAVLLTLWLLPIEKGAIVGLQWANRMHGFDPDRDEREAERPAQP